MDVGREAGCASTRHDIVKPRDDGSTSKAQVAALEGAMTHQALSWKENLQAAQHGCDERGRHADLSA